MGVGPRCRNHGYSLVEVMVAAIVLSLSVVAVVSVVRKGRELEIADNHRRAARAIIRGKLERNYDDRWFNVIAEGTSTTQDTIDPDGPNPVIGTTTIAVVSDTPTITALTPLPRKDVRAVIQWTENWGSVDSIVLRKYVANAR